MPVQHSVLNVKAVVATFNQEKALVGAFSDCTTSPINRFATLVAMLQWLWRRIYSELTMPKTPSAGKSEKCAWVAKLLDGGVEPN